MKKWRRLMEMSGIVHRSDLLTEQEDDLFGGDDEEGGDDEGGDEEGDADADAEEDADKEEGEDEDAPEELTNKEIAEFGPGEIDQELDQVFNQIFVDSQASAEVKAQTSAGYPGDNQKIEESLKTRSLSALLMEEDGPVDAHVDHFDLGTFCGEVARYIKNYQTLIDMEGMIYNKGKQFLMNQFGDALVTDYEEKMALEHGIDLGNKFEEELVAPVASGASLGAADGAT